MIKRFVVVISFLLGVLVVITWLLQQQNPTVYNHGTRNNLIAVIMLAITWGTPFILFGKANEKRNRD